MAHETLDFGRLSADVPLVREGLEPPPATAEHCPRAVSDADAYKELLNILVAAHGTEGVRQMIDDLVRSPIRCAQPHAHRAPKYPATNSSQFSNEWAMTTADKDSACVSTGSLTEMQTQHDTLSAIGIESRVVGEYLTTGLGTTVPGTVELWVHRSDAGAAEAALRGNSLPTVPEFTDIRIVGLDHERSVRADPSLPFFDVHFNLSALPPIGWARFVRGVLEAHGVAGRQGWAHSRFFVVRCAINEVEAVLVALRPLLVKVNSAYREWAAREVRSRADEAEFEAHVRGQLRDLQSQLKFE